ncbi:Cell cycle serine/threonine-protein kinase cdc5/MSD2 [Binucleata daphniae]
MTQKKQLFYEKNDIIHDKARNYTYKIRGLLGYGAFAQCFLVTNATNDVYALKVIDLAKLKSKNIMCKLETEIEIHKQLDHPNIVKMYNYFDDEKYAYLLLEYCENKGLDEYFKKKKKEKQANVTNDKKVTTYEPNQIENTFVPILPEEEVRKYMQQLIAALKYLHEEKSVIHRDLKLGNLFLDKHNNIKVGDFGLSSVVCGNQKKKTVCGTPNYIAPEVLFDKDMGHSFEVDIWSFGVILYTLLVGTPPFQKNVVCEIYETIKNIDYTFPKNYFYGRYSKELIRQILNRNPQERPSLNQIVEHRFFVKKENTVERILKNIKQDLYMECDLKVNNVKRIDFATLILPISRFKGIGYALASGAKGIYYTDYTNIVIDNDIISYLYRCNAGNELIIRKEDYNIAQQLPPNVKEKYDNLTFFVNNFCRAVKKYDVIKTHTVRLKKIKDTILVGLYNGVVEFEIFDCKRVVFADEGKIIYCFDHNGNKVKFTSEIKEYCLSILQLIK